MRKRRMVIALGHKDLGTTLPEQRKAVRRTAQLITFFVRKGFQIALTFSNAPQAGMIYTAMKDLSERYPDQYTRVPLALCSAMSQGLIGYDLQNAVHTELLKHGQRGVDRTLDLLQIFRNGAELAEAQGPAELLFFDQRHDVGDLMLRDVGVVPVDADRAGVDVKRMLDAQHAGSVWSQEATVVHDLVPTAFALDRSTINFNETAVLTFTALPEGYTHAWTVQDGSYVQSPESATKLILSFTSGGEKTITHTVTTPNGGTLTASATIQVMPAGVGEPILFVDQWGGSDLPVHFSMPMADYNFDGRLDGIKSSNSSVMTVMDGTNTDQMYNQAPGLWNTNIPYGSIKWYDYNRDGALDLITSSSSDYGVLYHDATLTTLTARQTDNNLLYFFEYYSNSYNGKPFGRDMTHNGLYDSWMHSNRPELVELDGNGGTDWKQFSAVCGL